MHSLWCTKNIVQRLIKNETQPTEMSQFAILELLFLLSVITEPLHQQPLFLKCWPKCIQINNKILNAGTFPWIWNLKTFFNHYILELIHYCKFSSYLSLSLKITWLNFSLNNIQLHVIPSLLFFFLATVFNFTVKHLEISKSISCIILGGTNVHISYETIYSWWQNYWTPEFQPLDFMVNK